MRTIKCQICGKEVEAKSSRQKYCPECAKEVKKERIKKWRENNKEYFKEYYENNKEYFKEYYENNKEYLKEHSKEWRENNKEKYNAYQKEYRENNEEYFKEYYENNKEYFKEWRKENYIYADREGNSFCVYIHTDPVGKVYIGRSFGEDVESVNKKRWFNGIGYKGQKFYDECIAVYGWDNIQHEIIEWGLTYEEVLEREQYWIERYNSRNQEYGYNVK